MKFLLTSGGLTTPELKSAFVDLLAVEVSMALVAYVPTAATIYGKVIAKVLTFAASTT